MRNLIVAAIALLLTACSIPAPKYSPSYENVQKINGVQSRVDIGSIEGASADLGSISLRGNSLTSPHGKDMIDYIEFALKSELEKANILEEGSSKKISAVVGANDLDSSSFSVGKGVISATFTVTDNGKSLYSDSFTSTLEWESSFIGAIAIPNAAASYPKLVTNLLGQLYSDKAFIKALK